MNDAHMYADDERSTHETHATVYLGTAVVQTMLTLLHTYTNIDTMPATDGDCAALVRYVSSSICVSVYLCMSASFNHESGEHGPVHAAVVSVIAAPKRPAIHEK